MPQESQQSSSSKVEKDTFVTSKSASCSFVKEESNLPEESHKSISEVN